MVGVGRIAPQKGPDHFAEVARRFAAQGRSERFTWIGRGNASDMAEDLVDAGVQVTGWLPKEDGLAALAGGSVLLHTARWEGFPVSLLEAVAVGVPILVLERPYARHLPPQLVAREDEMADRVAQILDDPRVREANLAACRRALADHTPARQREQLIEAYRSVIADRGATGSQADELERTSQER